MSDLRDDLSREFFNAFDQGNVSDIWAVCEAYADRVLQLVEAAGYRLAKCDCGRDLGPGYCSVCDRDE